METARFESTLRLWTLCPERANRRKAMETCTTKSEPCMIRNGVPRGPTAERQWRQRNQILGGRNFYFTSREGQPPKGNGDLRSGGLAKNSRTQSREGQPPKGNGDSVMIIASSRVSPSVPRGPTAERQWRPAVSVDSRTVIVLSREGQPPKGNGD